MHELRDRNVALRLGSKVTSIEKTAQGGIVTNLSDGRHVTTEMLLFAAGRVGATDRLNLEAAGIAVDHRGRITVDPVSLQTSVPHIYAAGDVIGFPSLASTSMEQGRVAACHALGMEREALARTKIEQSLRLAILEKRFCCAFQSKVDIRTQAVKGIEALVRLRDDEGVIQAPGSFINLASELGLIDELTHLVLAEIVKSIDLINDTFGPEATISINVAAKQAGNPEFMDVPVKNKR